MNRLRIVQRLAAGPATVTELIEHVGQSQPLVSWHLGKLRVAGIVQTRRSGRETVCTLRPEAFDETAARQRALLGLDRAAGERRSEPAPEPATATELARAEGGA